MQSRARVGLALCVLTCLTAGVASAAVVVHYFSAQCVNDQLVVDFKVSGLGQLRSAAFTVVAEAEVVVTCVNRGSKSQEPAGLIHTATDVAATRTFTVTQGQVTGRLVTVRLDPAQFQDECPPGMAATKVDVLAFHNVRLLDPSGNTIASVGTVECD
jgi:hypothetical protein